MTAIMTSISTRENPLLKESELAWSEIEPDMRGVVTCYSNVFKLTPPPISATCHNDYS